MYTISEIGGIVHLSRSALIYYDRIGLLSPSGRSSSDYRLYSEEDLAKLKKIICYRSLGISLKDIPPLLDLEGRESNALLIQRIMEIGIDIDNLRSQQKALLDILEKKNRILDKERILRQLIGDGKKIVTKNNYLQLHKNIEKDSPREHRRLLKLLGFSEDDIEKILLEIVEKT